MKTHSGRLRWAPTCESSAGVSSAFSTLTEGSIQKPTVNCGGLRLLSFLPDGTGRGKNSLGLHCPWGRNKEEKQRCSYKKVSFHSVRLRSTSSEGTMDLNGSSVDTELPNSAPTLLHVFQCPFQGKADHLDHPCTPSLANTGLKLLYPDTEVGAGDTR